MKVFHPRRFLACIWVLVMCLVPAEGRTGDRTVEISVGEQKMLPAKGVTRVAVGDQKVLEVRRLDKQILLHGIKPGRSSLLIWRGKKKPEKITIVVSGRQVEEFKSSCQQLLGEPCAFLRAAIIEGKLVLSGSVSDVEVYDKVRKVKKAYPEARFILEVGSRVLEVLVPVINEELVRAGLAKARVERIGKRLVIKGRVENEEESQKAELIVREYYDATLGND